MKSPSLTRLAVALFGAAVVMAVLATAVAFVIYGSWETEEQTVMSKTRFAAMVAVSAFTVFNLTLGLATVLLLLRIGRTGPLAFALGGGAAGLVFGLVSALGFGQPVEPVVLLVLGAVGALMLPLIRALSGLGRNPADLREGQ